MLVFILKYIFPPVKNPKFFPPLPLFTLLLKQINNPIYPFLFDS